MNGKNHLLTAEKLQRQKFRVVKNKSYPYSFFSLDHEGKSKLLGLERQPFGYACEQRIAEPILARTFLVYKPEVFIQEAWNRLYFEMLRLYKKRYKKNYNLLTLLREKHFKPASSSLKASIKGTQTHLANRCPPQLIGDMLFPTPKLVMFADKKYGIRASIENVELYEQLSANAADRKKIAELQKDLLLGLYEEAILNRFSSLSRKEADSLRRCASFPLRVDYFCVPKLGSRFRDKKFYFVEVKSERRKTSHPSLTKSQKRFIHIFKDEVGTLVLWMFLDRNIVEAQWLVPDF